MAEEKTYQIYEILAAAAAWMQAPEDEDLHNKFEEIKSSLIIKEYMPLGQKELCLRKALIDCKVDEGSLPYTASIVYEIALLFDCLLSYVVNLDVAIDSLYKDASFYDLIVVSGLRDYILSFCEKDYNQMLRLADRMIAFDNLKELIKNFELTSPEQINRLTNEFKNFTTNLNPEMLKHLSQIMAANDPLLQSVKESVENAAFNTANREPTPPAPEEDEYKQYIDAAKAKK